MARVECYIPDEVKEKLTVLAKKNGYSISKYISHLVENHLEGRTEQQLFQLKTQAMLANILSSVYDAGIIKTNADEVKSLIKIIDEKTLKRVNQED